MTSIVIKKVLTVWILLFVLVCALLIAQIRCQSISQTLDGSQTQLVNPQITIDNQEFINVGYELPPNCFQKCEGLQYYSCSICYKQCEYPNGTTFDVKTCEFKFCTWWDIFPYSADNPTSTYTRCTEWQTKMLSQQQCILDCCGPNADYNFFTSDTMQKCVDANIEQHSSDTLVIVIVAASLSVLFIFIISVVLFCWCRNQVKVCFQNFIYFFQKLCPCTNPDQKRKRQSNQDTTDSSKNNSKLLRSRRKWEPLKKKIQVTQFPTSKYIIESQYEINPEVYCSVCLDDELNCETHCKHRYHFQCFRQSIMKKKKCPQCTGKSFNPLKIICQLCKEKYTPYAINKQNIQEKYPDFYYKDKIYCDECFEIHLNRRRRQ